MCFDVSCAAMDSLVKSGVGPILIDVGCAMRVRTSGASAEAALRVALRVASAEAAATSGDAPTIQRRPFCVKEKLWGSSTQGFSMKRTLLIGAPLNRLGIEIVSAPLLNPVGHHDGFE